jgi:hypothetical protein
MQPPDRRYGPLCGAAACQTLPTSLPVLSPGAGSPAYRYSGGPGTAGRAAPAPGVLAGRLRLRRLLEPAGALLQVTPVAPRRLPGPCAVGAGVTRPLPGLVDPACFPAAQL